MAFLFADSFDHYALAELLQKWTSEGAGNNTTRAISTSYGRRGTQGYASIGGVAGGARQGYRLFVALPTSGVTCICGFAFTPAGGLTNLSVSTTEASSNELFAVLDLGTTQVWFRLNTDGTISALSGTTVLGTTSFALSVGVTYYLEFKVTIDPSAGAVVIHVDGIQQLNLTSKNTRATANTAWNSIMIGGPNYNNAPGTTHYFAYDDLYVLDGSGSRSNDFLGDVRVDATYPNAAGNTSNWTRSTGADQWATIDEALTNGDTDYNSTATVNNKDTLNFPNAPVAGADIFAVQVNMMSRKTDAGSAGLKAVTRIGGTDYLGTELGATSSYSDQRQIWDRKPSDATVWVDTDYNAAEFGYVKSS